MTNSEFIDLKTKLLILFIKKLLLGTIVFVAATATICTAALYALHWFSETAAGIFIYIIMCGCYIIISCAIESNTHNTMIRKLEKLFEKGIDKEKAIEELGLLPEKNEL